MEKNTFRDQAFFFQRKIAHEAKASIRIIIDRHPPLPVFSMGDMQGEKPRDQEAGEITVGHLLQLITDIVEGNDLDPAAHILQGKDKTDEIPIAGEQDDPVQIPGLQEGIDGQIHVRIGLGGQDPLVINEVFDKFLDNLKAALAQHIMIAVEFLPVFSLFLGPGTILGQIAVGPEQHRLAHIGQLDQDIIAHSVTAGEPDIFRINIDSRLQHRLLPISLTIFLTKCSPTIINPGSYSHSMVEGGLDEIS